MEWYDSIYGFLYPALGKWWWTPFAAAVVCLLYFVGMSRHIRGCRRRMKEYESFVRTTYGDEKVPVLITRHYIEEIVAYNESREAWPFRHLWKEETADNSKLNLTYESDTTETSGPPHPCAVSTEEAVAPSGERVPEY